MFMLLKAIYKLNAFPIKIPMSYFTKLEKTFQKHMWKHKMPLIAAAIQRKRNKVGEPCYLISNYAEAIEIKELGSCIKTDILINGTE